MKVGIIVFTGVMALAAPVFAEQPEAPQYITYKIKIDKNEEFEKHLDKSEQFFEQLKNNNLFSNWTKKGSDIPHDAGESFKKPSFNDSIEADKQKADYIKCTKGTTTK
jgi:hypothetical protein|tara:strand:+ start:500 stop:823 length:324 start_codon:yes stop_codon:yes gene_type:complete